MLTRTNQKQFRIEIKRRIGDRDNLINGKIWEDDWQDVTDYFIERVESVKVDLDDFTQEGKFEQTTTTIKLTNETGKFNPQGTVDSLWTDTTGTYNYYIYHSRLRYYEMYEHEEALSTGVEPTRLPLIDGLISLEPKYRKNFLCDISVNSKLDILREHYILEDEIKFNYTSSSFSILQYVQNLLADTYSELGISSKAGVLKEEIIYNNITPYSDDLLNTLYSILNDGGGYGGLTRNNEFFSAYTGASLVTKTNFEDDADCIGLYTMDDTDYAVGAGTTIYDKTAASVDLTTVNSTYNNWTTDGYFNNAVKCWWKTTVDTDWTDLTNMTIELLIRGTKYGTPYAQISVIGNASKEYTINPIIVFSNNNSGNLRLSDGVGTKNEEGLYYWNSDIYYMQITRGASPEWVINSMVYLGPMLGENFLQYIAFVMDSTTNEISFYLNGKLKRYVITTNDLGLYYTAADIKVMGRCFSQSGVLTGTGKIDYNDEMISVYYNSIKFSDTKKTEAEIFTQYEKLIGVEFVL